MVGRSKYGLRWSQRKSVEIDVEVEMEVNGSRLKWLWKWIEINGSRYEWEVNMEVRRSLYVRSWK